MAASSRTIVAFAFVIGTALAPPATAQPAPQPVPPPADAPLPGVQRFELRRDTFAEREAFLKRRAAEMREQDVQQVAPLPDQQMMRAPAQR